MDNKFIRNIIITTVIACVVVYIINNTIGSGAYLTMSVLAISSFIIGFLEPKRGWILALIQIFILLLTYFLKPITPLSADLAMFGTFAGCIISLVFSFVAGRVARLFRND